MIGPRTSRVAALALACSAALAAGAAYAQATATTAGNFGGGAIAVPVSEKTVAKDMLLAVRALPDGRMGVDGRMTTNCGEATIKGDTKLAADGSFALAGSATRKPLVGVSERTTFAVRGVLSADGGTGTAHARLRVRAKGRATRTCATKTVTWTIRRALVPGAGPAPAPPEALLYGVTAQDGPNAKRPIVLHVTNGGRSIDRLVMGFRAICDKRRVVVADEVNFSPEFDVAADGSFRSVEKFKITYSDVIVSSTIVVRGQFDAAAGVAGKLAVTERFTSRRSGKRVDACATGTQAWSAHQ
jgi:hypothetical protein